MTLGLCREQTAAPSAASTWELLCLCLAAPCETQEKGCVPKSISDGLNAQSALRMAWQIGDETLLCTEKPPKPVLTLLDWGLVYGSHSFYTRYHNFRPPFSKKAAL